MIELYDCDVYIGNTKIGRLLSKGEVRYRRRVKNRARGFLSRRQKRKLSRPRRRIEVEVVIPEITSEAMEVFLGK